MSVTTIEKTYVGTETVYLTLRSESGQVFNKIAVRVENWDDSALNADYKITMADAGGSLRTVTVPVNLPNGNWRAVFFVLPGDNIATTLDQNLPPDFQFAWNGTIASSPPVGAGIYADSTNLDDFYGASNITIYSDLDNVGTRDNSRIQKFLTYADDWINLAFKYAGRTTPVADTEDDFSALTMIAAEWAGAMLAKGRGDLPEGFSSRDGFDSFMDGHIERAEKRLAELVASWEESAVSTPSISASGAISVVVGDPKIYPGVGFVRPAAYTVDSLSGNASW